MRLLCVLRVALRPLRSLSLLTAVVAATALYAQSPLTPGARYREYVWTTPADGEPFLRVGGRLGYANTPGKFPRELQDGDELILPDSLALDGAVAATVTLERVASHEDTRDLRISVNGQPPIAIPEPAAVPAPQPDYMYHTDVEVAVPLEQLRPGRGNRFALSVDTAQRWGWPQNIFYAVTWRVYYDLGDDGAEPARDDPRVAYPYTQVPARSTLMLANPAPGDSLVDYVFVGRAVDWSGRGIADRKHYQTYRGEPHHTIGRSNDPTHAFAKTWDAAWLPEQDTPEELLADSAVAGANTFGVQARALGGNGVWRVGPVLDGLTLAPRDYAVHLLTSEPAPPNWVTRADTFEQAFALPFGLDRVTAYRLAWTSWSPCYANGLSLNGHLLWLRDGPCYAWATNEPTFDDEHALDYLQAGRNVLHTGLTPLMRGGEMVHGMEVQWPGVQVVVRVE